MIDPFMCQYFINGRSFAGIVVQNFSNDVTRVVSNGDVLWEVVGVHTDPLVGGLHIGRLERWLSNDERVDDDTQRPDVDFI